LYFVRDKVVGVFVRFRAPLQPFQCSFHDVPTFTFHFSNVLTDAIILKVGFGFAPILKTFQCSQHKGSPTLD
jgi:hypothetical protein